MLSQSDAIAIQAISNSHNRMNLLSFEVPPLTSIGGVDLLSSLVYFVIPVDSYINK